MDIPTFESAEKKENVIGKIVFMRHGHPKDYSDKSAGITENSQQHLGDNVAPAIAAMFEEDDVPLFMSSPAERAQDTMRTLRRALLPLLAEKFGPAYLPELEEHYVVEELKDLPFPRFVGFFQNLSGGGSVGAWFERKWGSHDWDAFLKKCAPAFVAEYYRQQTLDMLSEYVKSLRALKRKHRSRRPVCIMTAHIENVSSLLLSAFPELKREGTKVLEYAEAVGVEVIESAAPKSRNGPLLIRVQFRGEGRVLSFDSAERSLTPVKER